MKRLRLVCLSIVAVALLGATLASSASAYLAFTTSRGILPTPVRLTKFWEWLIFAFSTASGSGSVKCSDTTMTGVLESNSAKKDKAVIEETAFGGEGIGGSCESSLGPATITGSDEPWPNEFSEKKTMTIKGTKKVAFSVTFLGLEDVTCTYEASKVNSTFNAGTAGHPEPLTVNTSDQVFKAAKKSNAACPKTGELSGSIKAVANEETIEAEIVGKTKK
jgi:hypothetical protein